MIKSKQTCHQFSSQSISINKRTVNVNSSMHLLPAVFIIIIFCNNFTHSSHIYSKWNFKTHRHQSPINIITSEAVEAPLPLLQINRLRAVDNTSIFFENNGNGYPLKMTMEAKFAVSGGPLAGEYEFEEMHFHIKHWEEEGGGSEHKIDGESFDMEVHYVFFKKNLKTMKSAVHNSHGLAVIAVLYNFDVFMEDKDWEFVEQAAQFRGNFILDQPFDLMSGWIPYESEYYFTYDGSLTTPPYSENVKWIVFRDPKVTGKISFPFKVSRRAVQSIGDRSVYLIRQPRQKFKPKTVKPEQ